jgi:hypothetical protein
MGSGGRKTNFKHSEAFNKKSSPDENRSNSVVSGKDSGEWQRDDDII